MTETVAAKRRYEAPTLTVIGTFEDVTQATTSGTHLDATLPVGTPLSVVLNHQS